MPKRLLDRIGWIHAHRPLSQELEAALAVGHLRGTDLWHVATALYAAPEASAISFVTLDRRQAGVAAGLGGFGVLRDRLLWTISGSARAVVDESTRLRGQVHPRQYPEGPPGPAGGGGA